MNKNREYPITYIAQSLDIRISRIKDKIKVLALKTSEDAGMMSLSEKDTFTLLQSYIVNNKTSAQTKENAQLFLEELTTEYPKELDKMRLGVIPYFTMLIQFLQSKYFKFVALMVAIAVQMHHSATLFYAIAPNSAANHFAAYGYAFMVDLFILVVTLEGKISIAKTFAWLTFLTNLLYFQWWVDFSFSIQNCTHALATTLISAIIAYILYAYTELFVQIT